MIKLYLKQENKIFVVYWMKIHKNKIISHLYRAHWIGHEVSDEHTTYPESGKIHNTLKKHGKNNQDELFITAYPDETKYKTITNGSPSTEFSKGINLLNLCMPNSAPPFAYYNSPQRCYLLLSQGLFLPLPSERTKELIKPFGGVVDTRRRDIILIDADVLGEGTLAIEAFVASKDYEYEKSPQLFGNYKKLGIVEEFFAQGKIGISATFHKKT